ncbi:MAG: noncanonical pyrimidine nucleotidase, YjjG family [Chitinophagaceae bacterium]|nr:noncanonical pyrimidine nucleotidase, YjjG family [Chitinophagaceae bacterium]
MSCKFAASSYKSKSKNINLKPSIKYRHLFFDLDHTLWDFDTNAKEALDELYQHFKLKELAISSFDEFYTTYLHHNAIIWDRYHKGFITADELKWKRMQRTLLDFKIGDEVLAKDMSTKFLEILPTKKQLFDYTTEILDYLLDKKYILHLLTNGFDKTQWSKITNSDIAKYFTNVITSEISSCIKPSKEMFEFAINKAGAQLHESIMIGDNLDADIQGAINAGMDSIFVNHINATTTLTPTYTIHHLRELEDIL